MLRQPDANTVKVVDAVRAALPGFQAQLPQSVRINAVNDRSVSIRAALHDVTLTMLGTIVLVVLVIFLFLRRFVATVIPTLSLPVSLVGAVSLLWAFGYTLDNISLLGLTLAVGLVVDDAIVMLENIMRHVEEGVPPFQAALRGSREVGFTIISISSSLIAVFIPIFFMPGVIGLLFHEFAVIVTLAIVASAFVSLTLVPMLASRFLSDEAHKKPPGALVRSFERGFDALARRLHAHARRRARATAASCCCVAVVTFVATAWLFVTIPKGFFPEEDIGQISVSTEAAEDTSFPAMVALQARVAELLRNDPAVATVNSFNGAGGARRLAERRPDVHQPEAARRAPADEAGGRGPAPEAPRGAGHQRVHAADPEPAARRPAEQGAVPVHPAERAGRRAQRLGAEAAGADARRSDVSRRDQRFAAEGPAGVAEDRPRPRQHARRVDRRHPLGALQRLRRAPGLDDLHRRSTATR